MTLPPLPDLREALSALLKYAEINECQHDEKHRGGVIWTICDGCGRKWADDRNPFKGYQEPAAITNARAAIAAHVPEAAFGNIAAVPASAEDWLQCLFGATRAHPEWRMLAEAFNAGKAAAAPQAVPAGWVMVPMKPTQAMRDALRTGTRRDYPSDELCNVRYAAMLAAAPKEQPHE